MDDTPADIGVPPAGRAQALTESHPAEEIEVEARIVESKQTLTVPSNGSSLRKIEANRKNAKKSTGPKTSVGKTMSSWNSTRHGLLSKRLPMTYGPRPRQEAVQPIFDKPATGLGAGRHIGRSAG